MIEPTHNVTVNDLTADSCKEYSHKFKCSRSTLNLYV